MILENESPYNKPNTNQPGDRRSRITNPTPYSGLGKLPPQAVDLEEAVLGALMLEKDALSSVIDILKPEVFYKDNHQKIFTAIRHLFERTSPVDILTVTAQLRQQGELEMIGGAYYITELTNRVASAANIEYHSRIIIQKFIQRELIRISTEVINN
ncbi:MAG TPA: DnaB-like helicase N-terminal domain-containing protein, partial [Mucilaginibacter sp.]|nr:DnaB-like helicase N-terminal domain-containing protein [Mucilaginibacter sp.]